MIEPYRSQSFLEQVVTNIPSSFGACRCALVTNDPFDLTCQGLVLVDAPLSKGGTVGVKVAVNTV